MLPLLLRATRVHISNVTISPVLLVSKWESVECLQSSILLGWEGGQIDKKKKNAQTEDGKKRKFMGEANEDP